MLVAIDVGNSEVKLALVRDGRILATRRARTRSQSGAHDIDGLLIEALGEPPRAGAGGVTAVAAVSVVPSWSGAIADVARRLAVPLLVADARSVPMVTRVEHPERVGGDRLLNAYAALRLHGAPAIVLDFGTATTVDAVDGDGAFVGGAIAAGLQLGLQALASGTARLPSVPLHEPARAIGRDTAEAMQSGAVLGHVGLAHELIARISEELATPDGRRPNVVVTGGLSSEPWIRLVRGIDTVDPHLTIRGLALLHAELATPAPR